MSELHFDTRIYKLECSLDGIKEYYEISIKNIQSELDLIYQKHQTEINKIDPNDDIRKCELDDAFADYYDELKDVFIKNFNYSYISLLYSFLEKSLIDLCLIIKETKNIKIDLCDLKHEGIYKAKLFLQKLCEIDFPESSNAWQRIEMLNKIRNCIIHTDGDIQKANSSEKLKNIIMNSADLSLKDNQFIELSDKYIRDTIQVIEVFVFDLYKANVKHIYRM